MAVKGFIEFVVRRRIAVLLLIGLLSLLAAVGASRVGFDSSIEVWFLEDDPDLVTYKDFLKRFQADEIVVVGVFAEDVFTPEVLGVVDTLSREAEKAPYVHRVRSLTNTRIFRTSGDTIEIAPLVADVPLTDDVALAARGEALGHALVSGNLVSGDGRAALVLIEMDPEGNTFQGKVDLVRALEAIVKTVSVPGTRIRMAGSPHLDDAFFRYTERDMRLLGPLTALLVLAVTILMFRRLSAVWVPLTVVLLADLWTYGLMGALGMDANIVTSALLALILAVGIADSIHILSDYYRHIEMKKSRDQAVSESLHELFGPCFFTSATTAAGLLSLLTSDLGPVREFGWLSACGVLFAFFLSVTLAPALLAVMRAPDPQSIGHKVHHGLGRVLDFLGRPPSGFRRAVLVGAVPVVAWSVWSMAHLEVGANVMNYFRKNDPVRLDTEAMDEAFGGSTTVEFMLTAPDEGLLDPAVLHRIDELAQWTETLPGVSAGLSIVDAVKEFNRVLNGGDASHAVIPDSRRMIATSYLMMEGEDDFNSMVRPDYSQGRLTARVKLSQAGELSRRMPEVEARLDRDYSDEKLQVEATGYIKLMGDMENYLVETQIRSFLLAFLTIVVMMFFLLRSIRLGLFAMIPNVVPIAMGMGFMRLVGIALDAGTVMIAGIALGLVVDDTIHFLVRLRRHGEAGKSMEEGIAATMAEAGRPIMFTSVILACGFAVMGFGSFTPNVNFGLVSAVVILFALAADLLLLPAALLAIRPRIQ